MNIKIIFVTFTLLFLLSSCGEVKDNIDETLSGSGIEVIDDQNNINTGSEVNTQTGSEEEKSDDLDNDSDNDLDEKDSYDDSDMNTGSILTGSGDEDLSEEEIVKQFDKALDDIISDMLKDESN